MQPVRRIVFIFIYMSYLFFDTEDGGSKILRNAYERVPSHLLSQPTDIYLHNHHHDDIKSHNTERSGCIIGGGE
jgi:hypothetical protein